MGKMLDPANFFGKREGGINWAGAFDPGGKMVKDVTGSDIAQKISDPMKINREEKKKKRKTRASANYVGKSNSSSTSILNDYLK